jgi:hypothetical protein
VQDLELYELAVKADCAFNVSARTNGEMRQKYRQLFASCAPFLCARFKLLQDPSMDYMVKQLGKYEPSNISWDGGLAAVLDTISGSLQGHDGETVECSYM